MLELLNPATVLFILRDCQILCHNINLRIILRLSVNPNSLFKQINKFFLHILVDVALSGEGFTAFLMTAEGANEIWILDFLVEIADEGASGQVAACYFVEGAFLLRACCRIEDSHHAVHSIYGEKLLSVRMSLKFHTMRFARV